MVLPSFGIIVGGQLGIRSIGRNVVNASIRLEWRLNKTHRRHYGTYHYYYYWNNQTNILQSSSSSSIISKWSDRKSRKTTMHQTSSSHSMNSKCMFVTTTSSSSRISTSSIQFPHYDRNEIGNSGSSSSSSSSRQQQQQRRRNGQYRSYNSSSCCCNTDMMSNGYVFPTMGDDVLGTSSSSSSSMMMLDWYNPSHYVIGLVQEVHNCTGLSYAASIATVTVGMRLFLLLPMDIVSRKEQVKRDVIRHQYEHLTATTGRVVDVKDLYQRYNYNPNLRFVVPVSSLILFIAMLWGLKSVPDYILPHDTMGSLFWCTDITQPDPIRFLPILSATTFLLMGEVGADTAAAAAAGGTTTTQSKYIWLWRTIRLSICPLMIEMPASMFCFWIPNSMISLFQTIILNHPTVKTKWWNQIVRMNAKKNQTTTTQSPTTILLPPTTKENNHDEMDETVQLQKKITKFNRHNKKKNKKTKHSKRRRN